MILRYERVKFFSSVYFSRNNEDRVPQVVVGNTNGMGCGNI